MLPRLSRFLGRFAAVLVLALGVLSTAGGGVALADDDPNSGRMDLYMKGSGNFVIRLFAKTPDQEPVIREKAGQTCPVQPVLDNGQNTEILGCKDPFFAALPEGDVCRSALTPSCEV